MKAAVCACTKSEDSRQEEPKGFRNPVERGMTAEENNKEWMIRMELPGFEPAEVKVEVIGERLAVEAEHKEPEGKAKESNGRAYAHVKRTITLPPNMEMEKVEAIYRNGVLEIHVPRMPEAVGRRIEVKTRPHG